MPVELEVHADDAGQRVDRFLRKLLPRAPLSLVHRLVRQGAVRVDGAKVDGAHRLGQGSRLELRVDEERFATMSAPPEEPAESRSAAALVVVYEDEHVLVVDKPGGLAVHAGTGLRDHLVARLEAHLGASDSHTFKPAPAHRIDRGTSGLVVVGRSAQGLRGMTAAFRNGRVEKVYLAVVHGRPAPPSGTIDQPLAIREDGDSTGPKAETEGERPAITHYRTRRTRQNLSLLEVRIDTGRTHQVRAHLASIGCPIVGDRRYGAPDRPSLGAHRVALHAARLVFPHPIDGHEVKVRARVPRELEGLLDQRGKAPSASSAASRRRRRP